jgi:hypothetical protein
MGLPAGLQSGALVLAVLLSVAGAAQQPTAAQHALPNAPDTLLPQAAPTPQTTPPAATIPYTVHINGTVRDIQGGLVPGAHITVAPTNNPSQVYQTTAGALGAFSLKNLPPGIYILTITSPGLQTYHLANIRLLKPGLTYQLPEVALPIARTSADVTVTFTEEQLAEAELHAELHQRVFGVLPNFYVSYQWDAAPLSPKQKLKLTFRSASDPVFFATTAITAGIEQADNVFPEYGPGPAGYWRRYGAAYGDAIIGRTLGSVVFASLFRQDPRYFVMTNGSIRARAWHAVSSTFIQRGDNKHWQPAYAHLVGNATTGLIATTYHPGSSPGQLVFDNTVAGLGGQAITNLVREFLLRHLAKNIPSYAKGKPANVKTRPHIHLHTH